MLSVKCMYYIATSYVVVYLDCQDVIANHLKDKELRVSFNATSFLGKDIRSVAAYMIIVFLDKREDRTIFFL